MKPSFTFIILTPGFAADENDSTCLPLQQSLIRTIMDIYPRLRVVILSFQYPYIQTKYQWYGATVFSFNGRNRGGFSRLFLRQKVWKCLQQLYQSETIIGLFSFWYGECAAIGKKFSAAYRVKHYCWLLGQDAKKGNKYPKRYPPEGKELIALSDFIELEFKKNFDITPEHVLPPAINPKYHPGGQRSKSIDILAAGSLIPLKQYALLIPLVAAIKKQFPAVNAVVVGDGPEKRKLLQLITQAGLEKNLRLVGELPHQEVGKRMQSAKIFIHPSSYEGFGVVCLEALFAGTPVISFVKPMKRNIENWHVVTTLEEMVGQAIILLKATASEARPQLVYSMEETTRNLMNLYAPHEKVESLDALF